MRETVSGFFSCLQKCSTRYVTSVGDKEKRTKAFCLRKFTVTQCTYIVSKFVPNIRFPCLFAAAISTTCLEIESRKLKKYVLIFVAVPTLSQHTTVVRIVSLCSFEYFDIFSS
jgi:hypothetical protein